MMAHTELNIDDFYRLFTVGGMQHWCVFITRIAFAYLLIYGRVALFSAS